MNREAIPQQAEAVLRHLYSSSGGSEQPLYSPRLGVRQSWSANGNIFRVMTACLRHTFGCRVFPGSSDISQEPDRAARFQESMIALMLPNKGYTLRSETPRSMPPKRVGLFFVANPELNLRPSPKTCPAGPQYPSICFPWPVATLP